MKKTGLVFLVLLICVYVSAIDKADAATGSVLIPMAQFTPDGASTTAPGDFFKWFNGGYLVGSANFPCLVAPVAIPANASKINKLIVYLGDDGTGALWPYFHFSGITMATGAYSVYYDDTVKNALPIPQAIELPLLQHSVVKGRAYQLGVCLDAGQFLYGAKVVYTVP